MLGDLQHRVDGYGEEEAGGVDYLGGVHHGPVGLILEMGDRELVCGVELGDQRPVLVRDEDRTPTSGLTAHLVPKYHLNNTHVHCLAVGV